LSLPKTLADWLRYLETLHPKAIALGLDRVRTVYDRLAIVPACPVFTVAGTNGKGSTSVFIERMLAAAGYRAGLYTSPHLLRYNERVRIAGRESGDQELVQAFEAIEAVRHDVPLTYFEFGTLAALWLFARARLDALVLEVGLGGRLDAVNVVDADIAVVTTIALDHVDYLGATREDIGREKAGIFRPGRTAVCEDPNPPASLVEHARAIGAPLLRRGMDFDVRIEDKQWRYSGPSGAKYSLPHPALRGRHQIANAAAALTAIERLRERLPVGMGAIRDALVGIELPGRLQVLPGRPVIVLDVAHNPEAVSVLSENLGAMRFHPRTIAVFAIMSDKDIDGVVAAVRARVERWLIATLPPPRGAAAEQLRQRLEQAGVAPNAIESFDTPAAAYAAARGMATEADRIIVFGSFLTVAAALAAPFRL
jgi:dihydrofolate synthase/folylpolyglutamate synthase